MEYKTVTDGCQGRNDGASGPGLLQVLVEQADRALPRELRRRLVVARSRVDVEAVVRARVNVPFVAHVRRLERRLVRGPAAHQPLVELAVMDEDRRLDLRHVLGGRGGAVEGD